MLSFTASHVLKNPAGTYSVVGSVPVTCITLREPTRDDVMGGRIVETPEGRRGWTGRGFGTWQDAANAVLAGGGTLCGCCKAGGK
jgi:hypothetical protein